jgi:hypothetical protein
MPRPARSNGATAARGERGKDDSTMNSIHMEHLVLHRQQETARLRGRNHWLAIFEKLERKKG